MISNFSSEITLSFILTAFPFKSLLISLFEFSSLDNKTRSNIFIERGKITVFEKPQRLGQINSIGDLELHGYGYYKVEKQP